MKLNNSGQITMETLLIVAGAIIIAAVVGLYTKGLSGQALERISKDTNAIIESLTKK